VDVISRLLRLDRQEERRRNIDAFHFHAKRISATTGDLIDPKITARLIRLTVEKVYILLPHHVGCKVNRVGNIAICDKHVAQHQVIDCFTQMTLDTG
jgi:hypothetical protein